VAAITYGIVSLRVIAFQIALAAGVPWGEYAMGGAFPGQFPPELRVAAVVQAVILALLALVVLARAGVALTNWSRTSRWAIWVVVVFSAISLVLNTITPSPRERAIWMPVALIMLICSITVAVNSEAGNKSK
jgi:cell shape-determining protein MreD